MPHDDDDSTTQAPPSAAKAKKVVKAKLKKAREAQAAAPAADKDDAENVPPGRKPQAQPEDECGFKGGVPPAWQPEPPTPPAEPSGEELGLRAELQEKDDEISRLRDEINDQARALAAALSRATQAEEAATNSQSKFGHDRYQQFEAKLMTIMEYAIDPLQKEIQMAKGELVASMQKTNEMTHKASMFERAARDATEVRRTARAPRSLPFMCSMRAFLQLSRQALARKEKMFTNASQALATQVKKLTQESFQQKNKIKQQQDVISQYEAFP